MLARGALCPAFAGPLLVSLFQGLPVASDHTVSDFPGCGQSAAQPPEPHGPVRAQRPASSTPLDFL